VSLPWVEVITQRSVHKGHAVVLLTPNHQVVQLFNGFKLAGLKIKPQGIRSRVYVEATTGVSLNVLAEDFTVCAPG
jgi:hypothetical protein